MERVFSLDILGITLATISLAIGIYLLIKQLIRKKPIVNLVHSVRRIEGNPEPDEIHYENFYTLQNVGSRAAYDAKIKVILIPGTKIDKLNTGDFMVNLQDDNQIVFIYHALYESGLFSPAPITFISNKMPKAVTHHHEMKGTMNIP